MTTQKRKRAEQLRMKYGEKHDLQAEKRIIEDRKGRPIYALDSGGSQRPVLFVHGGGGHAGQWFPLASRVQADGHRVVLVDRPGHGLSYPIEYGDIDFREAAADFCEDVVDALTDSPLDIVANSMGGFFAFVFALRRPARIRRLITVGAPAGLDKWVPYPLRLLGFKPLNRLLFWQNRSWGTDEYRKMFDDLLVVDGEAIDEDIPAIVAAFAEIRENETAWRTLLEECVSLTGFKHVIRDEVANLDVPVRMIWGEEDAFAPPSSGQRLAKRMPDATVSVIENAAHAPWLDRPDECTRLLLRALDSPTAEGMAA